MKYLLILTIGFLASACNEKKSEQTSVTGTSNTVISVPVTDSMIRDETVIESIRRKVQEINNMSLLVQNFDYRADGCVDEGKISFYQSNDTTYKIVESGFIGDGGWTKEYYYYNGKYIFSFMQSIGGPAVGAVDTSEIREYVDSDTLVLLKRNKEAHTDIKQKWNNNSTEYKLLRSLKNKDFAKVLCN